MQMERVHLDLVALHFSTRCGAACTFCYAADPLSQRLEPTPLDDIERILVKLAEEEVKDVLFVGGDPVVHPDFVKSLEIAKSLGLTTIVLSNSWAIRPAVQLAKIVSLIDYCEATILGATSVTHDSITQRPGSFDFLLESIKRVSECGKPIGICANAMPENLREIFDMVRTVHVDRHIPVRSLMVQRIIPSGRSSGNSRFGLNLDDVDTLMQQVHRVHSEFRIPITFEDPVPWCTVDPQYHNLLARCEWGYTRGSINNKGFLNRCGADDHYRLGSIWDGNVQDIWRNHPTLRSFRSKAYLAAECQTCDLLEKCGGGCPLSCGTLKDHDQDYLYIQKTIQHSVPPDQAPSASVTPARQQIRFAYPSDLESIVRLEESLFSNDSHAFRSKTISRYFDKCPQAFRVAVDGNRLVGYLVLFPLTQAGVRDVFDRSPTSIVFIDPDFVAPSFERDHRGLFVEVLAASPDCSLQMKIALLRNMMQTMSAFHTPLFTCPISEIGLSIAKRLGFKQMKAAGGESELFALDRSPLYQIGSR